ncbi:DUF1003 domain-containing protein [Pantoea sp. B65]|uniref:DUF1003 domain-containing protein n=1 Tax=Pantoea sp. B65 TaxID=2813359 RepID=UPI0039B4B97B
MKATGNDAAVKAPLKDHLRFHRAHTHLAPTFGQSWFALKAEAFARFFGTPMFLGGQTLVVTVWIVLNVSGITHFDPYPFILLNLAFSLQAAYAAPLILLAETRQAERDKANAEADALHREDLARANELRQKVAADHAEQMIRLIEMNTDLTNVTKQLTERIEQLTLELHKKLV